MQIQDVAPEAGAISLRTLPGAAGTVGTAMSGEVLMSTIIGVLTIIFLGLQVAHLVWKWRRDARSNEARS